MEPEVHHGLVGREHQASFMNSNGKNSGRFKGSKCECDAVESEMGAKSRAIYGTVRMRFQTLNWLQGTLDSHAGVRSCFATGTESKDFVRGLHEEVFSQEF